LKKGGLVLVKVHFFEDRRGEVGVSGREKKGGGGWPRTLNHILFQARRLGVPRRLTHLEEGLTGGEKKQKGTLKPPSSIDRRDRKGAKWGANETGGEAL